MSDDEEVSLSAHALNALKEFYSEKEELLNQFTMLQSEAQDRFKFGMKPFQEDWNLSQFWVFSFFLS